MKQFWLFCQQVFMLVVLEATYVSLCYPQTCSLTGKILDQETGLPVNGANVVLVEIGRLKYTNTEGYFIFEGLRPGRYTISIHDIRYSIFERTLDVSETQSDTIVVFLRPSIHLLGEVIVQSSRTFSSINNSPYPINVETNDFLTRQSNVSVSDGLVRTPGLSLVRDGIWATSVSIRGMSRSNIISLVDNTRMEAATDIAGVLSLVNIEDIDRVEIMKSPGSVLYGSGAFGGVVHVVTKRPSFTDRFHVHAGLTNGLTSVDDGLSQHAVLESSESQYALRMSAGYRRAGNTMTPEGIIPNSQFRDFNLSASLGFKTIGEQSLRISYQRSQAEDTGIPGGSPIAATATATFTQAKRELFALEYTFPNFAISVPLLTFRFSRQTIIRNVEIIQNPLLTLTPHAENTTTNIQVESQIIPSNKHLLTLGVEVWKRDLDSKRERYDKNKNQIIGERPAPLSSYISSGIYTQNEWQLLPKRLMLILGIRYDLVRVRNDMTFNPEYIISSGNLQTTPANQKLLWESTTVYDKSWSANAGAQYALASFLDATFLAATAFRSPSLEERYQFIDLGNLVRVGDPTLNPERSVCLNAGLRTHIDGLKIQADFFLNHLTNLITEIPGFYEGRPAYIKTNIGEARLYGFEVSGEQSLASWLAVKPSISYVRGEDVRSHTDLPQIPPLNGQVELTGYFHSYGTVNISCTAAASQENLAVGETHTPGYAIYDINVVSIPWNVAQMSLTVRAGIQNLLNKSYQNHLSTLRGLIQSEPGRNFFLSATVNL